MLRIQQILLIIVFFFSISHTTIANAQNYTSDDKKAVKLYEKGQQALYQGRGGEAAECFEQALKIDPAFLEAHLMLAEWNLDAGSKEIATKHYREVVERNESFFTMAWLQLGNLELDNGNWDQAVKDFESFLKLDKKNPDQHQMASKGIEIAHFRQMAISHPVNFAPSNLGAGVNSKDDEYLPSLTADGQTLIFTRRGPRKANTTARTPGEEDFYVSHWDGSSWGMAERMPEPLNSTDNEGAGCVSQDGRIMFFTACERNDGGGRCDIYMCIRRGDQWSKPRNLGASVNSGAWEAQPSFSIDGKTLYFVSDRKGGYGGSDIWKTTFENGAWSKPENLGPTINTSGNEGSPFIHYDDQTLYFSSDGHIGMGGTDLFMARKNNDGSWQKPVNLGYPINTNSNESNLIVDASAQKAYYSSDRKGGFGKQDIYSFDMPTATRPTPSLCFKGIVSNAKTGAKVAADIRVVNLENGETIANTSSDKQSGEYIVSLPALHNYAFLVTADGFLFHSQNQECPKGTDFNCKPIKIDIALQPIEQGSRIALRNVFFETGRFDLLLESEYELNKVVELLEKNPTLSIELGGHTDNVGKPEANQKLSEQRAKAVMVYLTNKGIEPSRLSYKGYGESQPVAPNDTEEGRATNRRTEIKIL